MKKIKIKNKTLQKKQQSTLKNADFFVEEQWKETGTTPEDSWNPTGVTLWRDYPLSTRFANFSSRTSISLKSIFLSLLKKILSMSSSQPVLPSHWTTHLMKKERVCLEHNEEKTSHWRQGAAKKRPESSDPANSSCQEVLFLVRKLFSPSHASFACFVVKI